VVVRVDEDAVRAADPVPELLEACPQLCVCVAACVARKAALVGAGIQSRLVVAKGGGDDRAGALEQPFRMARDFGPSHGEAHVREEAALTALADVTFRLLVGAGRRGADDVEAELTGQPAKSP
jgi:hypothetical protein